MHSGQVNIGSVALCQGSTPLQFSEAQHQSLWTLLLCFLMKERLLWFYIPCPITEVFNRVRRIFKIWQYSVYNFLWEIYLLNPGFSVSGSHSCTCQIFCVHKEVQNLCQKCKPSNIFYINKLQFTYFLPP